MTPLDVLSTPHGAISLAVAALAAVLGVRLLLSSGAPAWAGLGYVVSLAATWAGASGLAGPLPPAPPTPVRLAGAALLVFGLLGAGRAARVRPPGPASRRKLLGGLALVLAGQLLRAPSPAGVAVAAAAGLALGLAAWRAGAPGAGHPNG